MRLEDIPGIKGRKEVHKFVKDHLSMLFEDVRGIIVQRGFNCRQAQIRRNSGLCTRFLETPSLQQRLELHIREDDH